MYSLAKMTKLYQVIAYKRKPDNAGNTAECEYEIMQESRVVVVDKSSSKSRRGRNLEIFNRYFVHIVYPQKGSNPYFSWKIICFKC